MINQPIYMTAEGHQALQERLTTLKAEKRPTVLRNLQAVSGGADWRESAELVQMQDQLALLDAEIVKIETMLEAVEIVTPDREDKVVDIGETVTLESDGTVARYTLVGPTEADPDAGMISYQSPLGSALRKRTVGDEFDVEVPMGKVRYRIVAVD